MKALIAAGLLSLLLAPSILRADDLTPGPVVGIGTGIELIKNHPTVISVLPGSPAGRDGVRSGDRIVSIDGKSVEGMDIHRVAQLLRGAENSRVRLTIDRNGHSLDFSMRRKILTIGSPSN